MEVITWNPCEIACQRRQSYKVLSWYIFFILHAFFSYKVFIIHLTILWIKCWHPCVIMDMSTSTDRQLHTAQIIMIYGCFRVSDNFFMLEKVKETIIITLSLFD